MKVLGKIKSLQQSEERKQESVNQVKETLRNIVEGVILIFIPITSLNIEFITLPIFLSVTFLLMQIRRIVNYIVDKNKEKEIDVELHADSG